MGKTRIRNAIGIVFEPNGRAIVVLGESNARFWEFSKSNRTPRRLPAGDNVQFSSKGDVLLIYESYGEEISVLESSSAKRLGTLRHQGGLRSAVVSPSGNLALSAGEDGHVKLWNIAELSVLRDLPHQGTVTTAAFSWNGRYVATLSEDLFTRVWAVNNGSEIGRFRQERLPEAVAFSPNDSILAVASRRSLHVLRVDASGGLLPAASRQLQGSWTGEYHFLDPGAERMLVLTSPSHQSWHAEIVDFGRVECNPVKDDIDVLQKGWGIRTGLQYDGEEVVPISVVRPSRVSDQRKTSMAVRRQGRNAGR